MPIINNKIPEQQHQPPRIPYTGTNKRAEEEEGEEVCFIAACGINEHGQLGWIPSSSNTTDCSVSFFTTIDWSNFDDTCTACSANHDAIAAAPSSSSSLSNNNTVIGTTIAIHNSSKRQQRINSNNKNLLLSAISCGESHTVCCWHDGAIYSWGSNTFGQLGLTTVTTKAVPPTRVNVSMDSSVLLCTATTTTTATTSIIEADYNSTATTENRTQHHPIPPSISSSSSTVIVKTVACGSFHTLIVTSDGYLLTSGKNTHGCLGIGSVDGDDDYRSNFTIVTTFLDDTDHKEEQEETTATTANKRQQVVVGAAAGFAHSLVLTQNGNVYSFGRGAEGQLGDGKICTNNNNLTYSSGTDASSLVHVGTSSSDSDEEATANSKKYLSSSTNSGENTENSCRSSSSSSIIRCYTAKPVAVVEEEREQQQQQTPDNNVDTTINDAGAGAIPHRRLVPTIVSGPLTNNPVVMIACSKGGYGSFAVTASDGYGWRWGLLDASKKNSKHLTQHVVPTPTPLPSPLGVVIMSSSSEEEEDGTATTNNLEKINATMPSPPPPLDTMIADAKNVFRRKNDKIVSISAGYKHLICVTRSGEAWAMGGPGPFLGLGHGCQVEWLHAPGRVLLPGDILINGVACGENHTLFSTICGKVFACGQSSTYLSLDSNSAAAAVDVSRDDASAVTVPKEVLLVTTVTPRSSICAPEQDYAVSPENTSATIKKKKKDRNECKNSTSKKTVKASFIGEYSYGRDLVCSYIQKKACDDDEAAAAQKACNVEDDRSVESFEDDEDYWGEDGLGCYGLEMGAGSVGAPYGGGGTSSSSGRAEMITSSSSLASLKRLTCETKRHICNSTLAVSGAIISGRQKISGIVYAVASGLQVSSSSSSAEDQKVNKDSSKQQRLKAHEADRRGLVTAIKLGRSESHQDSFDGLTGNSKRIILMSAGKNFSILHMADKLGY